MKKNLRYIVCATVIVAAVFFVGLLTREKHEPVPGGKYYIPPRVNVQTAYEFIYDGKTYHSIQVYSLRNMVMGDSVEEEQALHRLNAETIERVNECTGSHFLSDLYSIQGFSSALFLAYVDYEDQMVMLLEQDNDYYIDTAENYFKRYDLTNAENIYLTAGTYAEGEAMEKVLLTEEECAQIVSLLKILSDREIEESLYGSSVTKNYCLYFEWNNGVQVELPLYIHGLTRLLLGNTGYFLTISEEEAAILVPENYRP